MTMLLGQSFDHVITSAMLREEVPNFTGKAGREED
jgi:hypothetical protein